MSRVRRKPTEAFAWRVEQLCHLAASGWSELPDAVKKGYEDSAIRVFMKDGIQVATDTGEVVLAPKGHWLILNDQGEWYPCSPEAFEAGYEPADAVTTVRLEHGEEAYSPIRPPGTRGKSELQELREELDLVEKATEEHFLRRSADLERRVESREDRDRVEVEVPGDELPWFLTEEAAHAVLDQLCEHFGLEVVTAPGRVDARLPDDVLDELDDEDMTIERAVEIIQEHEARSDQSPSIRVMVNSEDVAALVRKLGGGEIRHEGTDEPRGVGPSEMEMLVDEPDEERAPLRPHWIRREIHSLTSRVRVLEKREPELALNRYGAMIAGLSDRVEEIEGRVDEPEVGVRSRLEWAVGQIRALKAELGKMLKDLDERIENLETSAVRTDPRFRFVKDDR